MKAIRHKIKAKKKHKEEKLRKSTYIAGCGNVPLVEETFVDNKNRQFKQKVFDKDFIPQQIPEGAILADLKAQNIEFWEQPIYYYLDKTFVCSGCGETCIWPAAEQKKWHEVYNFDYVGISRCLACRQRTKSFNQMNNDLSDIYLCYNEEPNNPDKMLNLAEAIVRHFIQTKKGRLDFAISLARKARKISDNVQTLYWEGLALMLSMHKEKGIKALSEYIEVVKHNPTTPNYIKSAKKHIADNQTLC
tara:strand:+ start:346 stop:1086 length:741 start_codon:yes stop_codon:yes gene_type:complete